MVYGRIVFLIELHGGDSSRLRLPVSFCISIRNSNSQNYFNVHRCVTGHHCHDRALHTWCILQPMHTHWAAIGDDAHRYLWLPLLRFSVNWNTEQCLHWNWLTLFLILSLSRYFQLPDECIDSCATSEKSIGIRTFVKEVFHHIDEQTYTVVMVVWPSIKMPYNFRTEVCFLFILRLIMPHTTLNARTNNHKKGNNRTKKLNKYRSLSIFDLFY